VDLANLNKDMGGICLPGIVRQSVSPSTDVEVIFRDTFLQISDWHTRISAASIGLAKREASASENEHKQ